ncbi:hypothetical protein HY837_03215 [archaeon]|nr:hypothetical protein [archaeon]
MTNINDCVKNLEKLIARNDVYGTLSYLGSASSIVTNERILLDLLIEDPEKHPEFLNKYNEQYHLKPELGLYHPSQYLLRIFFDEICTINNSFLTYANYKEELKKKDQAIQGTLIQQESKDNRMLALNARIESMSQLARLFISEIEKLEDKMLSSGQTKESLKEERKTLLRDVDLFLPVGGISVIQKNHKVLLDQEKYEEINQVFEKYVPQARALKETGFGLLDRVIENSRIIKRDNDRVKENFSKNKDCFLKKFKEFAGLFPNKFERKYNLVNKKTILSLSTTFYYRFYNFFSKQKYPMPIIIMPGRSYDTKTKSRIYVNELGDVIVRKETDEINIRTRTLYKNGTIYLANDLDLGLDTRTLFGEERRYNHWPSAPEIARLFGKYVFFELLKPKEMNAEMERQKMLGLFNSKGDCFYDGQGRDTFSTAVINYWKSLPYNIRVARFKDVHPREYDEETWAELFSLHFSYWLVSKRLADNPGTHAGRYEFYGPTDGFHAKIYSWFERYFVKKKFE